MENTDRIKFHISTIIKSVVFLLIAIILVELISYILRPETVDDVSSDAIANFHLMPKDSIEVLVLGPSRAWSGVDVMQLYSEYGYAAYNYACNWQHINTTEMFANDAYKTQNPRVVCIEMGLVNSVLEDSDLNGEIYYTKSIHGVIGKWGVIREYCGGSIDRLIEYFFPVLLFHSNWSNNFSKQEYYSSRGNIDFSKTMGYLPNSNVVPNKSVDYSMFSQKELPQKARQHLDNIVEICKKHGSTVILFSTPNSIEYNYSDEMEKYAMEKGVYYIDFYPLADEIGIENDHDYYDEGHLNDYGASKLASYLGQYIDNLNLQLTDYRQIENNMWEKALRK